MELPEVPDVPGVPERFAVQVGIGEYDFFLLQLWGWLLPSSALGRAGLVTWHLHQPPRAGLALHINYGMFAEQGAQ